MGLVLPPDTKLPGSEFGTQKLVMEKAIPKPSIFNWRIIAFYIFAFAAGGVIQPFLNLYLLEVGLTGTQIGVIQGWAAFAAILITPTIGLYADRTQRHRFLLGLIVFVKGLSAPLMLLSAAWGWLAVTVSARVITSKAQDALMNRLTLAWLKERNSLNLGSIRFWGALSFAATSLLAGYLASGRSVGVLFPLAGVMGIVAVYFVQVFPAELAEHRHMLNSQKLFSKRSPQLLFLFAIIFLFWLGGSGTETFVYVHLSANLAAGNQMIGLLGAVSGLAPLPALYLADWLRGRWGAVVTMAVGIGLYGVAWAGFALITEPGLAIPLNVLQGFGQALYMISMVILMGQLGRPEQAATDQMLAQLTVPGLAGILAQPVSGWLFDAWGGSTLFMLDAIIACLAIGLLLSQHKTLTREANR